MKVITSMVGIRKEHQYLPSPSHPEDEFHRYVFLQVCDSNCHPVQFFEYQVPEVFFDSDVEASWLLDN
jgi:hypothetical protein